ncbi:hypothetical protein [Candidatus Binatus sp.]|uniref:hypothetical protein n=1 Tax=Candidatus Binatus sp. TaxID=2811406 RepID=UPI003C65C94B
MKAILSTIIVALFSMALAGCWFYSQPDSTAAGCQKTTYGVVTATSTSENCPPDAGAPPAQTNVPPGPPPLPSPGTM